jgi:glucose-6-phosphate 1-epimerase
MPQDVVSMEPGQGGLESVVVRSPLATARVYLHGAHVAEYRPAGREPVLFMSGSSHFHPEKPIRGGVPVIFPWFGPRAGHPESPAHGFARTRPWTPESSAVSADGVATIVLALRDDDATRALWPQPFALRYAVAVGSTLTLSLTTTNPGPAAFTFEQALHTYFAVPAIHDVSVTGLAGVEYIDKVDGFKRTRQGGEPIRVAGETDRVYLNTAGACALHTPTRTIVVEKAGSNTTVVWNPWVAKAKAMADFGDDEWPRMICIESANAAENAVTLAPGASHTMAVTIRPRSISI